MAKTPYGVKVTTNFVTLDKASLTTLNTSRATCLRSTPISATPKKIKNRTTAGTILFDSAWNGLDGINKSTKLKGGRSSTRVELKNEAVSRTGNAKGIRNVKMSAKHHRLRSTAPARRPSVFTWA